MLLYKFKWFLVYLFSNNEYRITNNENKFMSMNISSFIVKASIERSVKSLGCLIPIIIGRVPRLSRRNK